MQTIMGFHMLELIRIRKVDIQSLSLTRTRFNVGCDGQRLKVIGFG